MYVKRATNTSRATYICQYDIVRDSSLCALEIRDNVQDSFFSDNFFFRQIFFLTKNLFLGFFLRMNFVFDWNLSRTEFCLGLHTAVVFRMQSFNVSWECRGWLRRNYSISLKTGVGVVVVEVPFALM